MMTKQTEELIERLPNFAQSLEAADARNSSDWEIVRWKDVHPQEVGPEHIHVDRTYVLEGKILENRFTSRTPALIASGKSAKEQNPNSTEKGHRGVWKWKQGNRVLYQTVLPVKRNQMEIPPLVAHNHRNADSDTMVPLSEKAHRLLQKLAAEEGKTLQAILDKAVKEYDRQKFFDKADAAYRALRSDPEAWAQELKEREEWDAVLMDDIDRGEIWQADGTVTQASGSECKSA